MRLFCPLTEMSSEFGRGRRVSSRKSHHLAMVPVKLNSHAATSGLEVHLTDVRILLSARDFRTALRILPMLLHKLERRPELDALRGLFLVWMTLTHLPTRFSDFVNQPIGFVSSAEGFVFISALLVGRLYIREFVQDPVNVRSKLWKRSFKIYGYHLAMLAFAFTVVAAFAVHTHKAALINLLNFYLAHPMAAIVGSVLLFIARRCSTFCRCTSRSCFSRRCFSRRRCAGVGEEFSWRAACSGYWRSSDCATWCITGSCTSRICEFRCRRPERSICLRGRRCGPWGCGSGREQRWNESLSAKSLDGLQRSRGDLPVLCRNSVWVARSASHHRRLWPAAGQMADRAIASGQSDRASQFSFIGFGST